MNSIKRLGKWWKEDPSRRVNFSILKQKLFSPIYFLTTYRGFIVLIVLCSFFYWLGQQAKVADTANAVNDYQVVDNACNNPDALKVRYERIVSLFDQTIVKKLVFYCP